MMMHDAVSSTIQDLPLLNFIITAAAEGRPHGFTQGFLLGESNEEDALHLL